MNYISLQMSLTCNTTKVSYIWSKLKIFVAGKIQWHHLNWRVVQKLIRIFKSNHGMHQCWLSIRLTYIRTNRVKSESKYIKSAVIKMHLKTLCANFVQAFLSTHICALTNIRKSATLYHTNYCMLSITYIPRCYIYQESSLAKTFLLMPSPVDWMSDTEISWIDISWCNVCVNLSLL